MLLPVVLSAAGPTVNAPVVTEMSLTAPDGFVLKGTLTVPAAAMPAMPAKSAKSAKSSMTPMTRRHPVVILAHQFGANRAGWKPLADRLNAAGIATLALDLRGHGASTRRGDAEVKVSDDFEASAKAVGFDKIPADLAQAAAWVRKQPGINARRLGLAGSSIGAFAALTAMPQIHPVAVLALSPAGTTAFGPGGTPALARAVEQTKAAVMVMASREDQDAAANATALGSIPGVYARMADGKAHGFAYLDAQSDTMAVFLATYLKDHDRKPAAPASAAPAAEPGF